MKTAITIIGNIAIIFGSMLLLETVVKCGVKEGILSAMKEIHIELTKDKPE